MLRQLKHVIKSYATRKLFWFLLALYLFFMLMDYVTPRRSQPLLWRETQVRWLPEKEFNGMTEFLDWPATDEELLQLRSLRLNGQFVFEGEQSGSDGKPILTLRSDDAVGPKHLEKLEKCKRLVELHWHSVRLSPEVGQTLGRLSSLRTLDLSLIGTPTPRLEHLPGLPSLRYFIVPSIPLSELGMLAKHPQLETIELRDRVPMQKLPGTFDASSNDLWSLAATLHEATQIENVIVHPLSEHTKAVFEGIPHGNIPPESMKKNVPLGTELISEIASLPHLKAVEIRDPGLGWPARTIDDAGMRQALAARPDVKLNAVALDDVAFQSPFIGFSSIVILLVLGLQLAAQFGVSHSIVTPGFSRPHLLVALFILAVHSLLCFAIHFSRAELTLLPSIVISLSLPALICLVVLGVSRFPSLLPVSFSTPILFVLLVQLGIPKLLRDSRIQLAVESYQTVCLTSILIVELTALFRAGRAIKALAPMFCEAGVSWNTSIRSMLQQMQLRRQNSNRTQKGLAFWRMGMIERRLESYLANRNFRDRQLHWRVAEMGSWQSYMLFTILGPWCLVGIYAVVFGALSGQWMDSRVYVFSSVLLGTFSLVFATIIIGAESQGRRPTIQQELLRPMLRSELSHLLLTASWIDLRPFALTTVGYLFMLPLLHNWAPKLWSEQPVVLVVFGHALVCLSLPFLIWASLQLLMTISSELWRITLVITLYLLLFGLVQSLVLTHVVKTPLSSTIGWGTNFWISGFALILAGILAYWAKHRLPNVEWAASGR